MTSFPSWRPVEFGTLFKGCPPFCRRQLVDLPSSWEDGHSHVPVLLPAPVHSLLPQGPEGERPDKTQKVAEDSPATCPTSAPGLLQGKSSQHGHLTPLSETTEVPWGHSNSRSCRLCLYMFVCGLYVCVCVAESLLMWTGPSLRGHGAPSPTTASPTAAFGNPGCLPRWIAPPTLPCWDLNDPRRILQGAVGRSRGTSGSDDGIGLERSSSTAFSSEALPRDNRGADAGGLPTPHV